MPRSLKELLIDDYLDFDDDHEINSTPLGDEQHRKFNIIPKKNAGKERLRQIIRHPIYDYFMAIVVISSSITLGLSLETDEIYINNYQRQQLIYAFDEIFIGLLFIEFSIRIYLESSSYWLNWINLYDFIVLISGLTEILWNFFFQQTHTTITTVLKGFRFLQLIRLYRVLTLSEGVQVLTRALIKTVLTYTFSLGMLVFLCIYVVAVIGQMLYGKPETSPWHHFSPSLVIAMRLIFVDNWNLIGPELEKQGSPTISRWFLSIVVTIGNRLVTNVLVGLMINSVSSANDEYIKMRREKKLLRNQNKREELSKRTVQMMNTRLFSNPNHHLTRSKNLLEQMNIKLKSIQNETITPTDFLFSIDWLETLVACSEKNRHEAKSTRHLIVHIIQSLADIIEENIKRNENEIDNIHDYN